VRRCTLAGTMGGRTDECGVHSNPNTSLQLWDDEAERERSFLATLSNLGLSGDLLYVNHTRAT